MSVSRPDQQKPESLRWRGTPTRSLISTAICFDGTSSRQYTQTIDVGNVTSFLFTVPIPTQRYYLALRAYNTAGAISPYSNEVVISPVTLPLTVTGISANKTSPQAAGTTITFAATATGGTTPYQFKWWIVNGASTTLGKQWSTSNSFAWTPTVAGSGYKIRVWARNASSTADQADNPGAILETTFTITAATNLAPTVSAGADKSVTLPSSVSLTGAASDDGKPAPPGRLTLTWTRVSGPGTVTFGTPNAAATTATFSASGTYVLRLTASDSALSKSDDVTVTVNPSTTNLAPTVSAGADKSVTLPGSVSLTGAASDDGKPAPPGRLTLTWTRVNGPGTVTFGTPNAAATTATFSASGTYVLRLTASDSALSKSDDVTVTVNPSTTNLAPTVSAGPDKSVTLPGSVSLTGAASDDGKPAPPGRLTLTWTRVNGPGTVTFGTPNAAATTATFSASGTYVLRLTASDSALSKSDEVTITVNPAGTGPGLRGQYFKDSGTGAHFTTLVTTRIDPTVNFNWGNAVPITGVTADNFSVRWTGQVLAPTTGNYTFVTYSDDGVRLWVNNQLVIDHWSDHTVTRKVSATIPLTAGARYSIRLEYFDHTGPARIQLYWTRPGQWESLIPNTNLFQ